jgi:hypothetical protein
MKVYLAYINMMNEHIRKAHEVRNPWHFHHVTELKSMAAFDDSQPVVVMASPGMLQVGGEGGRAGAQRALRGVQPCSWVGSEVRRRGEERVERGSWSERLTERDRAVRQLLGLASGRQWPGRHACMAAARAAVLTWHVAGMAAGYLLATPVAPAEQSARASAPSIIVHKSTRRTAGTLAFCASNGSYTHARTRAREMGWRRGRKRGARIPL